VLNVRPCRVSFTDTEGITHTAEVSAASLFEAAALGVAEFRRCGMMDVEPGPATHINRYHCCARHLTRNPYAEVGGLAGWKQEVTSRTGCESAAARNPGPTGGAMSDAQLRG
jgi:hypothetical protein